MHVNWFEANAFCHWLTQKLGGGRWIFGLASEAEWEKAARGPDNFDYGLGMNISNDQVERELFAGNSLRTETRNSSGLPGLV